ncbi:MAG: hypothetical protein EXS13_04650 [Planctomycetes bacterium]|nr:hypothetical protein [Planctomycetota bacterium]
MGRRPSLWCLLAAALGAASCVHSPLPTTMAPVSARARAEPASAATVAVLDFDDARLSFERTERAIDERSIGGGLVWQDRFWSFHSADGTLFSDPASAPELRARITGDGAFAWYPFPNHGWGTPLPATLDIALADYVALHLEQRRVFAKVIRCADATTAVAAGATLLLSGRIDHFGAIFVERRDPLVPRPDDWAEFRLLAGADYTVRLTANDGAGNAYERRCRAREDLGRLQDPLEHHRGRQREPHWQLDADGFPAMAESDMTGHARLALEAATVPLIADLETMLVAAAPTAGAN